MSSSYRELCNTFFFEDLVASTGDARYVELLPAMGAFTVQVQQVNRGLNRASEGSTNLFPDRLAQWNVGIAFCNPQDVRRYDRSTGELLAYQRMLDNPWPVNVLCDDFGDLFPWELFEDVAFLKLLVQRVPYAPRWLEHAIDLSGYLRPALYDHRSLPMVVGPLANKVFKSKIHPPRSQRTPREPSRTREEYELWLSGN